MAVRADPNNHQVTHVQLDNIQTKQT